MRLFTGIRPSDDFRAALAVLQDSLRAAGITGRYLEPSNLHMTLAFIGEWPEDITQV
ncbi:MAG: RNA 2',3'-cyclic phosphodiesterase, partial [Oscillospiraceae bacterium]|nr:RNA 2',3'-cyclic phosphodiesterase [Oscillospiraceae bacterium]